MAKSRAKKLRTKMEREGKRNPELNRGTFAMADLRTRRTKTKLEKLNHIKHKKHLSDLSSDGTDGCFLYVF